MNAKSNYQDLLKIIAISAMIIDHIGLFFFPQFIWMRYIGRIAMPIFCFFAGYNFKTKLNFKILGYGILLHEIYIVVFNNFLPMNILISIFLGQLYLYCFQQNLKNYREIHLHILFLTLLWFISFIFIDYGTISIAIMVLGYTAKNYPEYIKITSAAVSLISTFHTYMTFDDIQNLWYLIILLIIIKYILFNLQKFTYKLAINIKSISRNSLFLYFISTIIIWICYTNSHC